MAQVAQALGVQSQAEKQLLDVYAETDNDMRWLRASIEGLLIAAGIALPNAENGYSNLPYIMYWGETVHQGLMAGAGYRDTLVESVGPERAAELMKYLAI